MSTFILVVSVQHTVKTKGDMASRLMIIYLNQPTTFSASVSVPFSNSETSIFPYASAHSSTVNFAPSLRAIVFGGPTFGFRARIHGPG